MTLASLSDYRTLTGDTATDDATVNALLPVAQSLIEIELGREGLLTLGVHVETLDVWDGIVYPTAAPIDSGTPGYVSATKFRPTGASLIEWIVPLELRWGDWRAAAFAHCADAAKVTYTGGYDATTAPYPLKLAIARLVKALLPNAAGMLAQVPAGTKSLTVGDVSLTFARALGVSLIPVDVMPLIQPYRATDAVRT